MKQNGQNIMFLQPPIISYIWNATRDMKLQYLLGLEKFKASGQSLGNLKLPLQVRRYLMYTVCPIADRGLVLILNYIQCSKSLPGSISGAVTSLQGSGHPLSAPSEATWTTKQFKTEIYHEKSFDVLIATILYLYIFHGHLDVWACSWQTQISEEASSNLIISFI